MEEQVRKELDTLLSMVSAWKDDKISQANAENGWDFLVGDLMEEIGDHVAPYVRRLVECEYITEGDRATFLANCMVHVDQLAEHLAPAAPKEV